MKTKLLAISLIATLMAGCDLYDAEGTDSANSSWERVGVEVFVKVVTIKGHDYVIMHGHSQGGIVHAASCPCHKNSID